MEKTEKKHTHLTYEGRIKNMECLYKRMTFKAIAKRIAKDPTTVSKEVKLHGKTYSSGFTKTLACCPKHLKAPFVCNGCERQDHSNCSFPRRKYHAKTAQQEYETTLKESREGIPLNKKEFYRNEKNDLGCRKIKPERLSRDTRPQWFPYPKRPYIGTLRKVTIPYPR